jgi:hypothetical protein
VHSSSFARIDYWVERIKFWIENGLEDLYIILHPGNDAAVLELADYWVQQLNSHCGFHLKAPQQQTLLF